jgi:hypothetical protein
MSSPLDSLVDGGSLHRERPDVEEYDGLVRSGRIRLRDAESNTNALESRFDLAYNAAHALCLAALRRSGYRPANKRYVVFQALPHTLGLGPEVWRVLDLGRSRRNRSEYQGDPDLTERLVADLIVAAKCVLAELDRFGPLGSRWM